MCLEAKKCVIGKEKISPSITAVNNNAFYDFCFIDGSINGTPILFCRIKKGRYQQLKE